MVAGLVVLLACSDEPRPAQPPTVNAPDASEADAPRAPDASETDGLVPGVPDHASPATVTSITDGDTLRVDTGRDNEPVRLLELDTPEVGGDGDGRACEPAP